LSDPGREKSRCLRRARAPGRRNTLGGRARQAAPLGKGMPRRRSWPTLFSRQQKKMRAYKRRPPRLAPGSKLPEKTACGLSSSPAQSSTVSFKIACLRSCRTISRTPDKLLGCANITVIGEIIAGVHDEPILGEESNETCVVANVRKQHGRTGHTLASRLLARYQRRAPCEFLRSSLTP